MSCLFGGPKEMHLFSSFCIRGMKFLYQWEGDERRIGLQLSGITDLFWVLSKVEAFIRIILKPYFEIRTSTLN